jgi:hypothetical protein
MDFRCWAWKSKTKAQKHWNNEGSELHDEGRQKLLIDNFKDSDEEGLPPVGFL